MTITKKKGSVHRWSISEGTCHMWVEFVVGSLPKSWLLTRGGCQHLVVLQPEIVMLPLLPPGNGVCHAVWNFCSFSSDIVLHLKPVVTLQNVGRIHKLVVSGCKESRFYSLPFGQAEANIYQPKRHFNQPKKRFDEQN